MCIQALGSGTVTNGKVFSTSGRIGFGYWKKTSGSGSGITDGYDGKVIELLKLSKSSDEKSDYFRFSWNATRVLL